MPTVELINHINAPVHRCFDLSRSIDLHTLSTAQTGERAIAGVTSGLIGMGQTVTWRARHLGVWQTLTTSITEYDQPRRFVDVMTSGVFKSFRHEHIFEESGNGTQIIDRFEYESPLGIIGRAADWIFLKSYMTKFLIERNQHLKLYAETDLWKQVLNVD
ncbi:MAG: SRPBCC family protein [Reichenbachiella sp.]|uniref:SRPBCC family protein n=1 Tax=Reichenbachiella sp. TaxID=2184521 RepID=UPI00326510EC